MLKRVIAVSVVVAGLLTIAGVWMLSARKDVRAADPTPVVSVAHPPAGSIVPDPQWLADYDSLTKLSSDFQAHKIAAIQQYLAKLAAEKDPVQRGLNQYQLENDLIIGLNNRLASQVREGMVWNAEARVFSPKPAPPPATPTK